jgi:TPR repeat protein
MGKKTHCIRDGGTHAQNGRHGRLDGGRIFAGREQRHGRTVGRRHGGLQPRRLCAGIRLFRPLAEQGNPKALGVMGIMYRKGEGVGRSPLRAFMWLSLAVRRGDTRAKGDLRDVSNAMTSAELSQAREMADACEASNYRNCEY